MPLMEFQLFCNGESVNIEIEKKSSSNIGAVLRFNILDNLAFLLTNRKKLFHGIYDAVSQNLSLQLWKEGIVDIDVFDKTVHLVFDNGSVRRKRITANYSSLLNDADWETINFTLNGTSNFVENKLNIIKVKSNSKGTIFLTDHNEIYGHGACGSVLTTETPAKLGKFFENQKVIDIACGNDFFLVLTQRYLPDLEECEELFSLQKYTALKHLNKTKKKYYLRRVDTVVEMFKNQSNKNAAKTNGSYFENEASSSASSNDSTNLDDSIFYRIQEIIRAGYALIHTSVCSFGARNESVLGTGDHIKRQGVHPVLYLTSIGCYNISCGKEHSICRTLDGRIFHWGVNTSAQQTNNTVEKDITAPKEMQLESFSNILEGYCEGYRTILCNNEVKIFQQPSSLYNEPSESLEKQIFNMHSFGEKDTPIMLISKNFTLLNSIILEIDYLKYFSSMQTTLRSMLRNHSNLQKLQLAANQLNRKAITPIIHAYNRMVYAFASCLQSVEHFYRKQIDYKDLLFLNSSQELIDLFDDYTRHYCDIKSINGFAELTKQFTYIMPNDGHEYEKIFAIPFEQISNILGFCELLNQNDYITNLQISNFLAEKQAEWQAFSSQQRIETEIAENTEQFWLKNMKISQIRQFKKKFRRVILDSINLPLKLSTSGAFSSSSFILFSDCLCQYGSQLQMFPLLAVWVQVEGDTNLRIYTPEKTFLLVAKSHEDKMLWYDQLTRAIIKALGKPEGSKLTSTRNTMYEFSDKHPMYPKVKAYGRWRFGVMHGTFYLEYADSKVYFGEVRNNEIEGYGKMIIPTAGIYEGTFKGGKFSGTGSYEMRDSSFYEGNFKDGLFHGHGTLKTNNYTYIGEFFNNVKNGYGIYDDLTTGDKYMGMFAENRKTGAGACVTINGDYFEGFFINDNITGEGLAVFTNGNYYLGHMTMNGPDGKGCFFVPAEEIAEKMNPEDNDVYMVGSIISGNLGGIWSDIRVISGNVSLNKKFLKIPKEVGDRIVDNNRKWRSLFDNWEEIVFGSTMVKDAKSIWNKIAVYITLEKDKEKAKEQNTLDSVNNFFGKNIALELHKSDLFVSKLSNSLDKININSSTNSLAKLSNKEKPKYQQHKRSHSNEILFDNVDKFDQELENYYEENVNLNNFFSMHQFDSISTQSSTSSTRSSIEGKTNLNNNIVALDIVPDFGINALKETDIQSIRLYLEQAFKDQHHPLNMLYNRIANSFYLSYGCWRMKPTSILAYQAIKEWESISMRVYRIIRKLFPALPVDSCDIEENGEPVSHINLLYPILLSEGIYSTLCVLYANKYREQDEIYRQRIILIDRRSDQEIMEFLFFESSLLNIISTEKFKQAIVTFKQITEECSPKGMLDILEKSIELIHEAQKHVQGSTVIPDGGADNIVPLTLFLVLRANVPHLGAELALLDDLTGEANHELNLSGLAGYCFTTIKAAYEHIVKGDLFDVLEQNFFLSHRKF